jgi:tRNA(Ile)-lysidine synthase
LSVYREETEAYCREHQLTPRRDPSNVSLSFLRNRIRHQLLPLLQSFNPRFGEALLRTARILGEETAFFEAETARLWSDVAQEREEGLVLNLAKLTPLHPAVQRYLLRSALRRVLGDLRDIEEKHIEKLRAALSLPPGSRVSLPQGLTFSRGYGEGIIGTSGHISCPFLPLEGEFPLSVPGESVIPGWKVRAVIREERERKLDGEVFSAPGLQACFDLEAAGRELSVRSRRPGDRFQPLGMAQPKKLQDFMVDAKIPRQWRDRIPLVCSPHRILWVAGWRIDERAKVTSTTKQVLCLEFIPQCPSSASSS